MGLKFIEKPQKLELSENNVFSDYLLENDKLMLINGGTDCGVYHTCGKEGKNSCQPFDCTGKRTSCKSERTWVLQELC